MQSSMPARKRRSGVAVGYPHYLDIIATGTVGRIVLTGTENSAGDNATIDTQDYIDWVSTEFDDNQRPYRSSNPISSGLIGRTCFQLIQLDHQQLRWSGPGHLDHDSRRAIGHDDL